MARGKTNQPLVIWVYGPWVSRAEIGTLRNQGHFVVDMTGLSWRDADVPEPDLILHPVAHRWDDELWDYLDIAIKAARARRRKK